MPLKLGAYTACLHDRPLTDALDVLRSHRLTSVEVNTGGFLPAPHCPVDLLLSSERARRDYLDTFAARGAELTGLNCNGNPLSPLPGTGPKHADDLRRTIRLAGELGVRHVERGLASRQRHPLPLQEDGIVAHVTVQATAVQQQVCVRAHSRR